MILEIRKVDGFDLCYSTKVDISKIVAIENRNPDRESINAKYNTFRVYFDFAVWNVYVEDYDKLFNAWKSLKQK
jgi:hypothetical protein